MRFCGHVGDRVYTLWLRQTRTVHFAAPLYLTCDTNVLSTGAHYAVLKRKVL
jgi:hypothetical protein